MPTIGNMLQDRYRIASLLGQGGMGAVYRAWDTRLNVPVALKEMTPQPGLNPDALAQLRKQFQQEATVLARLNHPHLVRVTDFFEESGNTYLVMGFVEGENLADRITRHGALPEAEVLTWARQLLDALAYCHAQGVIHRDVKPQNVIVRPDGRAVLVDFGLVKLWDPRDPRTKTAMRGMGTPEYAPPEQYEADMGHTDPRSDIYSLGATIYHALVGQAPPTATMRIATPEHFAPVRALNPRVSPGTEAAVLQAMELARSQRWQSTEEMAAALGAPGLPAPTQPPGRVVPVVPRREKTKLMPEVQPAAPARRIPVWAWALGGLAVLVLCAAIAGLGGLVIRQSQVAATTQAREQATTTAQSQMIAQTTATAQVVQRTATAQAQATATQVAEATSIAQAVQTTATARAQATARVQAQATATMLACIHYTGIAPLDWSITLCDTFSTNVNDWPDGDYSSDLIEGNKRVANDMYRWEGNALGGVVWWSAPDIDPVSDFYLTVETRQVSGAEDAQYGVIFGKNESGDYGLFKIEDSQDFKVALRYDDKWTTLIDWTKSSEIQPGETNRLTVIAKGSHFTFYINDRRVGEIDETRLGSGKPGVAIELDAGDTGVFEFDNFEVHTP